MTSFDFDIDNFSGVTSMVRHDCLLTFSNECANVHSDFELRSYNVAGGAEDPFDIGQRSFILIGSADGRLVTAD